VNPRDLTRALRADFWPKLRSVGFDVRTDRAAWRYADDSVDVIDVWSVGPNADACGCPSVSFSAMAGSIPSFMPPPPAWSVKNGQARPRHTDCQLKIRLEKTISQPWFKPFVLSPKPTTPLSFLKHRRGLQAVLRTDRHDRPDIWFVKDDASNLDEVIADLWHVTQTVGLPVLNRLHDPCAVIEMVLDRTLVSDPESMFAEGILHAARRICQPAP
jgi:hypothetical protein